MLAVKIGSSAPGQKLELGSIKHNIITRCYSVPGSNGGGFDVDQRVLSECAHFVNVPGGLYAVPLLKSLGLNYMYTQNDGDILCQGEFNEYAEDSDYNMLMHYVLGHTCLLYDATPQSTSNLPTAKQAHETASTISTTSSVSLDSTSQQQRLSSQQWHSCSQQQQVCSEVNRLRHHARHGAPAWCPNSIWYGIEWTQYICQKYWMPDIFYNVNYCVGGVKMNDLFEQDAKSLSVRSRRRYYKYFRQYYNSSSQLRLFGVLPRQGSHQQNSERQQIIQLRDSDSNKNNTRASYSVSSHASSVSDHHNIGVISAQQIANELDKMDLLLVSGDNKLFWDNFE